ncbi:MAG: prolyl-tRNA synthetase associated domain-containing protein [Clostridiales bacterium]|nr:prolyl-tRNA synthetase associated domain-containing protein [Clostridiales bacterium]
MEMTVYRGRPENTEGRLLKEIKAYNLLDSLGIDYVRIDHQPTATIEACFEVEKLLGTKICKNLFLTTANKTHFYLYFVQGDKKFKTAYVSKQAGCSRLSFAAEDYLEKFLDLTPGSVTVLGLMNDRENNVRLLIDEDILKQEYVGMHPCINTSSIKLKTEDLIKKLLPAMGHDYTVIKAVKSNKEV